MSYHMYKGNSPSFTEADAGGYYYAFTPSLPIQTYTEAYANIVLPTRLNVTAAIPRNAYISLGLTAEKENGFDAGLCNKGRGWFPCYYDVYERKGGAYEAYISPSNATNAIVIVKPIDKTHVHMYVQFQDANGRNVGSTFDRTFDVKERTAGWRGYYRFASLIPSQKTASPDDSDETYMIGGKFTGLGLYNGKIYEPWGIPTSRCEIAWAEDFPKAQLLDITTTGEEFRIDHWA